MKNQFWVVGRWSGLDCEIKGSGPILSNFEAHFLPFSGSKTMASALKSCIEKRLKKFFFGWKIFFFRKTIFLGLKFECKYMKVENRLLLTILCKALD